METDTLVKQEPTSPSYDFIIPTTTQHWEVTDLKNLGRGIDRYGDNNWENIAKDESLNLHHFSPESLKNKWQYVLESTLPSPLANKSISEKPDCSSSSSASLADSKKASKFLYVNASQFKAINFRNNFNSGKRLARRTNPSRQKTLPNTQVRKNVYTQKPTTQTQSTRSDIATQPSVQPFDKEAPPISKALEKNTSSNASNDSPILSDKNLLANRKITYSHRPRKLQKRFQAEQLKFKIIETSSSENSLSESDEDFDSDCQRPEIQKTLEPSDTSFKGSEAEGSEESSDEDADVSDSSQQSTALKSRRQRHPWSREEEEALFKGVETYGEGQWAVIRADSTFAIHPRRSKIDIKDKWRTICRQVKVKTEPSLQPATRQPRRCWTTDEIKALCEGVNLFGAGHWKKIAEDVRLFGRTTVQLKDKWRNLTSSGLSNEAQFFSVVDEKHDVLLKNDVPWEILSQDAKSAALLALSKLLSSGNSSTPKKRITFRILPQFSNQVLVYHGTWASVTPSFPVAQLLCRELVKSKEVDLSSSNFSTASEKSVQNANGDITDFNSNNNFEKNVKNVFQSPASPEHTSSHMFKNTSQDTSNSEIHLKTNKEISLNSKNVAFNKASTDHDYENNAYTTKTSQHHCPPESENGNSVNTNAGYISEVYDLTVDSIDFV